MDRLNKSAWFLSIQESFSTEKLVGVYVREIVAGHGVLISIVSDNDVRLTLQFW